MVVSSVWVCWLVEFELLEVLKMLEYFDDYWYSSKR